MDKVGECEKPEIINRSLGLDILRIIAFMCVISIHLLTRNAYGSLENNSFAVYLVIILRSITRMCIPLFLLLSGYLLVNKDPNAKYFKKILRILFEYLLASVVCALFSALYYHDPPQGVADFIRGVFGFQWVPYSWYINMYIGLFLLAPFINKIFKQITQKQQQLFLAILIGLTMLPSVVGYMFSSFQWYIVQLPTYWWSALYMLTYFFVGQYIRMHQPKVNRVFIVWLFVVNLIVAGLFNYKNPTGHPYDFIEDYYTIFVFISSVCTFLFFYDFKYKREKSAKIVALISASTLSAYMISWVFDVVVYGKVYTLVGNGFWSVFRYAPIIIAVIAFGSLIYGIIVTLGINIFSAKLHNRKKSKM